MVRRVSPEKRRPLIAVILALSITVLFFRSFGSSKPVRTGQQNDNTHAVALADGDVSSSIAATDCPTCTASAPFITSEPLLDAYPTASDDDQSAPESKPIPAPPAPPVLPDVGDPQLHVVIAHYKEEPYWMRMWLDSLRAIPFVQELGLQVIIYTKGPAENIAAIQETTAADQVIPLPNVGREGGTYLHHILAVYNAAPQFTLFTQAQIKKGQQPTGPNTGALTDWLEERLRSKFDRGTGFMSLDEKHNICYCGRCTDMGRRDFYPLWPQLYAMMEGELCQQLDGQVLSFNGHFIVSRKRILDRPRSLYEYLKGLVDAPADHWLHSEPEPVWFENSKGRSVPSNPKFGHTLERLWHTLFRCYAPGGVVDCDVRGMRSEGLGGCTCKDMH